MIVANRKFVMSRMYLPDNNLTLNITLKTLEDVESRKSQFVKNKKITLSKIYVLLLSVIHILDE